MSAPALVTSSDQREASRPEPPNTQRDANITTSADMGWLARLAHVIKRYRWIVIGVWIVLTLFGGYAAGFVLQRGVA